MLRKLLIVASVLLAVSLVYGIGWQFWEGLGRSDIGSGGGRRGRGLIALFFIVKAAMLFSYAIITLLICLFVIRELKDDSLGTVMMKSKRLRSAFRVMAFATPIFEVFQISSDAHRRTGSWVPIDWIDHFGEVGPVSVFALLGLTTAFAGGLTCWWLASKITVAADEPVFPGQR